MVDRPILFSAPMVQALLDGRKTQTRRTLGGRGNVDIFQPGVWADSYVLDPANAEWRERYTPFSIGDRLWVKETWRTHKSWDEHKLSDVIPCSRIWYEADGRDNCDQHGKTRVSIFMPRWASRITLNVTDVRVERLQDCSEEDAWAEGLSKRQYIGSAFIDVGDRVLAADTAPYCYRMLWNHINGERAWEANPWVVAVSFDVRKGNIDGC